MAWSDEARRKAVATRKANSAKSKNKSSSVSSANYLDKNSTINSTMRTMKKQGFSIYQILLLIVLFIGFFVGGFVVCRLLTIRDDFELIGKKSIVISVGQEYVYQEDGYIARSFNKDVKDSVKVTTDLARSENGGFIIPTDTPGEYVIKYTITSPRLKNIVRYRVFKVV